MKGGSISNVLKINQLKEILNLVIFLLFEIDDARGWGGG